MNKNSFAYRVFNSLKHLVVTTFLGLILYFFMIPIITQLPWITPVLQVILILMFTVSIYLPFWEYGDKDNNLVNFNRKSKDMAHGLKIAFIIVIPYLIASVFLLLYKLGVQSWALLVYRIVNVQFIYIVDHFVNINDISQTSWWSVILCMILPLYTVIVAEVAYVFGYKRISIKEKLIYKNKSDN